MFNKRILNNLKIGLYSLTLFNSVINVDNTYADDFRIVSFQNEDQSINIYDMDSCQFISYDDLLSKKDTVEKLHIEVSGGGSDLSFLEECSELTCLEVYNFSGSIDLSFLEKMSDLSSLTIYEKVPFSVNNLSLVGRCKNLDYLSINSPGYLDMSHLLNLENLNSLMLYNCMYQNIYLLKNMSSLEHLRIKLDEEIPGDLFSDMTFLKELKLNVTDTCNIDYKKLTYLEELNFEFSKSYTIAIYFTTDDFNILRANGVKVRALNGKKDLTDEVYLVNNKLDEIVSKLNVLDSDTDQKKLDKVLIYVLDNLNYDRGMINSKYTYALGYKHYEKGLLYQALEDNQNAICGNYAALVSALAKRVGLACIYLQNDEHAWNLVKIDGIYYGIDATFLDQKYRDASKRLKAGNYNMDWYLVPLNRFIDKTHTSNKSPVLSSNTDKPFQKRI